MVDSTISLRWDCHKIENAFFRSYIGYQSRCNGDPFRQRTHFEANIAYAPVMTMDGGNPLTWMQSYIPIETHFEMNFNMVF